MEEMKDLNLPTLPQVQTYLRNYLNSKIGSVFYRTGLWAKEKGADFIWFLLSFKRFCFFTLNLDLEKVVLYIKMDACDAELNAFSYENTQNGESCFPKSNFLMCWFHVGFNVGKQIQKNKFPKNWSQ